MNKCERYYGPGRECAQQLLQLAIVYTHIELTSEHALASCCSCYVHSRVYVN